MPADEVTLQDVMAAIALVDAKLDTHLQLDDERRGTQEEKITSLDHAVNGNGKIGLKTRVDRIEQRWIWIGLAAGAGAAGGVSLVVQMVASALRG